MTLAGLRPGEKLYEELLVKTEELDKTPNSMIFIERDIPLCEHDIDVKLEELKSALIILIPVAIAIKIEDQGPVFYHSARLASIAAAKRCGFEFYYASNWDDATEEQMSVDEKKYGVKLFHMDLDRSPYSTKNIQAYKQLVDFIKKENIDYIHCNTPVVELFVLFITQYRTSDNRTFCW